MLLPNSVLNFNNPTVVANPSTLTEDVNGNNSSKSIFVKGIIQRADAVNKNGRIYPFSVLQKAVNEYSKNFLSINNGLGELDHPQERDEIKYEKVSHNVKKLWWEGKDLWALIEILNTPSGQILQHLLEKKIPLGISSRSLGSLEEDGHGNTIVQDDLQIICWDFVTNPSTYGSYMKINESVLNSNSSTGFSDGKKQQINFINKKIQKSYNKIDDLLIEILNHK